MSATLVGGRRLFTVKRLAVPDVFQHIPSGKEIVDESQNFRKAFA
jgi:hypothetical protein